MNFRFNPPNAAIAEAWLREVAVWAPFVTLSQDGQQLERECTDDEHIDAIADFLADRFPPEVFCEATVKRVARMCDTFPNYYWCCKALEGYRP